MQVGDPKKALVLAIVAIVIIGVAAFQLFPKGTHLATMLRQNAEGQTPVLAPPPDQPQSLPDMVTSSPFAKLPNPKLRIPKLPPPVMAGTIVGDPGASGTNPLNPNGLPLVADPAKNAGDNQQQDGEVRKTATLRAILRVHERIAVFELTGFKEIDSLTLRGGSWLNKEFRVIEMGDHELTLLDSKGKKITLAVGKTLNL